MVATHHVFYPGGTGGFDLQEDMLLFVIVIVGFCTCGVCFITLALYEVGGVAWNHASRWDFIEISVSKRKKCVELNGTVGE